MTSVDLFASTPMPMIARPDKATSFYATPTWACEALLDRYYPDLSSSDMVVEPTCGEGHFLDAIPRGVPAIGIELDPKRAMLARRRTGREVVIGDVLKIELPATPTVVVGNPPFRSEFVDQLLDRVYEWLPDGGRCGLIVPSFIVTKTARLIRESERWSVLAELIPRDLFPGPRLPIVFARFEKRRERTLVGFALFHDAAAVRGLPRRLQQLLAHGRAPAWRAVVFGALRECGGEATLEQIYRVVAGRRPTPNPHWRAKVRQVVHCYAHRVGPGKYRLPEAA
jgi:hypothetical protein